MSQPARIFVTAEIAQACPGYREARIYLREPGTPEPFGLIAFPQSQADDREALAAFGWKLTSDLEYVAGLNQFRGTAEPCEPEGGEALRETVRREIRARTLARVSRSTARHFHPVQLGADHSRDPIGWTFMVRLGADRVHGWVTASGEVYSGPGIRTRADAARDVRHAHMMNAEAGPVARASEAQLQAKTGTDLARLLLTVRDGGQIAQEDAADGAEEATAEGEDVEEEPEPFEEGDRIICADGMTRTVRGIAPRITGEPVRLVVEDGSEWIAENCLRANREDVLDAHRKCNAAGQRVRTNPDPSDPEWRAALAELGEALDYLRRADPTVRAALVEEQARKTAERVHPKACHFRPVHRPGEDEPVGWSFSLGQDGQFRYGVVSRRREVAAIGIHECRSTAERAFLYGPREEAPAAG